MNTLNYNQCGHSDLIKLLKEKDKEIQELQSKVQVAPLLVFSKAQESLQVGTKEAKASLQVGKGWGKQNAEVGQVSDISGKWNWNGRVKRIREWFRR